MFKLDAASDGDQMFYGQHEAPTRITGRELRNSTDRRVVIFRRGPHEAPAIGVQDLALSNTVWPLEHRLVYHTVGGFEWGYGGSGPAEAALNILALVLSPKEAMRLHHEFKDRFLSAMPRVGGELSLSDIRAWIDDQYTREVADVAMMAREKKTRDAALGPAPSAAYEARGYDDACARAGGEPD